MKVRLTSTSRGKLEAIADYLGRDDPDFAIAFISDLRTSCLQIGEHPYLYPIAHGVGPGNLRRRLVSPYLIFYRVEDGIVFIHGVVHGSRNIDRLFSHLPT